MNRPMVTLVVIYCVCVWSTLCFSCIEADPLPHQRQMNTNGTSGNGEALSTGGIFGIVFGVITSIAATIGAIGVIFGIVKDFQRPKITHHPVSTTVAARQTAELKCKASGKPAPKFQWLKNDCNVAVNAHVKIATGNGHSTLTINDIQKSDAGKYKCKASSLFGYWDDSSDNATITIAGPPTINQDPGAAKVKSGTEASFTCAASSDLIPATSITSSDLPPMEFSWQKDGSSIITSSSVTVRKSGNSSTLTLKHVSTTDAGSYTCTASYVGGSVTSNAATLQVTDPPTITQSLKEAKVKSGSEASFTCAASSDLPMKFSWQKDGSSINFSSSITVNTSENTSTLTLKHVSTTDAGSYTCTVSNDAGSVTSNAATLQVTDPPTITQNLKEAKVKSGSESSFTCVASSDLPMKFSWQKDGSGIIFSPSITVKTSGNMSTLILKHVSTTDAGSYTCTVSNDAGSVTSNAATLQVTDPPTITHNLREAKVRSGAEASFTCVASSDLPMEFSWQKDGSDIILSSSITVNTSGNMSTLTLKPVSTTDAGSYTCTTSNDAGSVTSKAATLQVADPPTITQDLKEAKVKSGSESSFTCVASSDLPMKFSWQKDGSGISSSSITVNTSGNMSTLTMKHVSTTDAGSYTCTASNDAGSVTSKAATLQVTAELSSDAAVEIKADQRIVEELRELGIDYSRMLTEIKRLLARCDISDARFFLEKALNTDIFTNCINIEQLLNQLCDHNVDLFNVYYLQKLATYLKRKDAQRLVKQYEKKKENFLQKTTVLDFHEAIKRKVPLLPKGMAKITIRISKKLAKGRILKDMEDLAYKVFGDNQEQFVQFHVIVGSVVICWFMVESLCEVLQQLARAKVAVWRQHGVEEVMVGSQCVYCSSSEKEEAVIRQHYSQGQKDTGSNHQMITPLLFLFVLETTGLDVNKDQITKIASKVFNSPVSVKQVSFESLVYTAHPIPEYVQQMTGIIADMLKDKDPFPVVLHKFLNWISTTTQEVSEQTGHTYRTVLVAHNGFEFHCPLLFAEIERAAGLDTSILENIYFADTFFCLRQERDKIDFLRNQILGLKSIHTCCFPDKRYNAHRAMPDVEALEEVLQHPQVSCIQEALVLNQRPASEIHMLMKARASQ